MLNVGVIVGLGCFGCKWGGVGFFKKGYKIGKWSLFNIFTCGAFYVSPDDKDDSLLEDDEENPKKIEPEDDKP